MSILTRFQYSQKIDYNPDCYLNNLNSDISYNNTLTRNNFKPVGKAKFIPTPIRGKHTIQMREFRQSENPLVIQDVEFDQNYKDVLRHLLEYKRRQDEQETEINNLKAADKKHQIEINNLNAADKKHQIEINNLNAADKKQQSRILKLEKSVSQLQLRNLFEAFGYYLVYRFQKEPKMDFDTCLHSNHMDWPKYLDNIKRNTRDQDLKFMIGKSRNGYVTTSNSIHNISDLSFIDELLASKSDKFIKKIAQLVKENCSHIVKEKNKLTKYFKNSKNRQLAISY